MRELQQVVDQSAEERGRDRETDVGMRRVEAALGRGLEARVAQTEQSQERPAGRAGADSTEALGVVTGGHQQQRADRAEQGDAHSQAARLDTLAAERAAHAYVNPPREQRDDEDRDDEFGMHRATLPRLIGPVTPTALLPA